MIRAQPPVRDLGPFCSQGRVLEDGGLEVERLAVECPSIEQEAITHRILFQGIGKSTGLHG